MRNGFFVALMAAGIIVLYVGCAPYQGPIDVDAEPPSPTVIEGSDGEISPTPGTSTDEDLRQAIEDSRYDD